jgi:hypothetical protein
MPFTVAQYHKTWRNRRRRVIIDLLGGECRICGFDDNRALQFDHVHGDEKQDKNRSNRNYLSYVLNSVMADEGKFQLLCANCNWIKRAENGEVRKS